MYICTYIHIYGLPRGLSSKETTCQSRQKTQVPSLGREDPVEKEMATRSSILAWKIPWTEEPGGLQAIGSHGVGHDQAWTHAYTYTYIYTYVYCKYSRFHFFFGYSTYSCCYHPFPSFLSLPSPSYFPSLPLSLTHMHTPTPLFHGWHQTDSAPRLHFAPLAGVRGQSHVDQHPSSRWQGYFWKSLHGMKNYCFLRHGDKTNSCLIICMPVVKN